jgi:hypothetical protein
LAAESDRVEIELTDVHMELRDELAKAGFEMGKPSGQARCLVLVDGPVEPVLRLALEHRARVLAVTPARESLEALFVRDALAGSAEP